MSTTDRGLTLDRLEQAVRQDVAIRLRTELQPAGGRGDKIFPPTYAGGCYAMETRRIDGEEVKVVLLDSVQSQANRMELALLDAYRAKDTEFSIPMLSVSFEKIEGLADLGEITVLDAPHRIADAIFRDSYRKIEGEKVLFPDTPEGQVLGQSSPANATPLFRVCPTALIFGVWDSTGATGGLGTKFARTLVSEIVGLGATTGKKTASRIDPLQIESVPIYRRREDAPGDRDWTAVEDYAERDANKGEAIRFARKDTSKSKGRPSEINHGNVTPDLVRASENVRDASKSKVIVEAGVELPGGVTVDCALHTAVLSLAALRKLKFPCDGQSNGSDAKARLVLAALGLAAIAAQRVVGYDLRSRCLLVASRPTEFEIVGVDGSTSPFQLSDTDAFALFSTAREALPDELKWDCKTVPLTPTDSLVELVRASRMHGGTAEELPSEAG